MTEYEAGDQVEILVGGPHENLGRTATVSYLQSNGDVVIYFGDQDEDEWVYSPNELIPLAGVDQLDQLLRLAQEYRPTMHPEVLHDWAVEVSSAITEYHNTLKEG
jgi:hypothetical protein